MPTDLLGTELTPSEARVLSLYHQLKAVVADDELAPCTRANLCAALAPLGIAVTDLGLAFEHLTDLDV